MSQKTSEKVRGKNYSDREKDCLLDILAPFKNILECNETNKKSNIKKANAWKTITDTFNSQNTIKRDTKSLINVYKQMKMQAKKEFAASKREKLKTGGGPSSSNITPIGEKMINYMGSQIQPLKNPYDSAAGYDHLEESQGNVEENLSENQDPNMVEECIVGEEIIEEEIYVDVEGTENNDLEFQRLNENVDGTHLKRSQKRKICLASGLNDYISSKKVKYDEKTELELKLLKTKLAVAEKQLEITNLEIEIKKTMLRKENAMLKSVIDETI